MQILVAPTRQEIDRAHASHTWLHIGVPSLRNLTKIDPRRVVIYAILALSSCTLHLLYESPHLTSWSVINILL